jgi:hypothetical protein
MIESNQVYIRFRGRTVGPVVKSKALEMAKRGQLTRSHEISFDGSTWSLAGDVDEFFPAVARSSGKAESAQVVREPVQERPKEQWYAHLDGENQGPMDDMRMMALIDSGKIKSDTMVWKSGTPSWIDAQQAFAWKFHRSGTEGQAVGAGGESDMEIDLAKIAPLAQKPKMWTMFLGIAGAIVASFSVLTLSLAFIEQVSSVGGGPVKVVAVIWFMIHIILAAAFVYCSVILIRFSNAIGILNYRVTAEDFEASLRTANHFWKWLGITVAFLFAINIAAALALTALGVSIGGLLDS